MKNISTLNFSKNLLFILLHAICFRASHSKQTITDVSTTWTQPKNIENIDPFYSKPVEQEFTPVNYGRTLKTQFETTRMKMIREDRIHRQHSNADGVVRVTDLSSVSKENKPKSMYDSKILINSSKCSNSKVSYNIDTEKYESDENQRRTPDENLRKTPDENLRRTSDENLHRTLNDIDQRIKLISVNKTATLIKQVSKRSTKLDSNRTPDMKRIYQKNILFTRIPNMKLSDTRTILQPNLIASEVYSQNESYTQAKSLSVYSIPSLITDTTEESYATSESVNMNDAHLHHSDSARLTGRSVSSSLLVSPIYPLPGVPEESKDGCSCWVSHDEVGTREMECCCWGHTVTAVPQNLTQDLARL